MVILVAQTKFNSFLKSKLSSPPALVAVSSDPLSVQSQSAFNLFLPAYLHRDSAIFHFISGSILEQRRKDKVEMHVT